MLAIPHERIAWVPVNPCAQEYGAWRLTVKGRTSGSLTTGGDEKLQRRSCEEVETNKRLKEKELTGIV